MIKPRCNAKGRYSDVCVIVAARFDFGSVFQSIMIAISYDSIYYLNNTLVLVSSIQQAFLNNSNWIKTLISGRYRK